MKIVDICLFYGKIMKISFKSWANTQSWSGNYWYSTLATSKFSSFFGYYRWNIYLTSYFSKSWNFNNRN